MPFIPPLKLIQIRNIWLKRKNSRIEPIFDFKES